MNPKAIYHLLKDAIGEWSEDKSAALEHVSLITACSIGPLIVLTIGVASLIWGQKQLATVVGEIEGDGWRTGRQALQQMLAHGHESGWGTGRDHSRHRNFAVRGTGCLRAIAGPLNTVWKVTPKPGRGVWGIIQRSFLVVDDGPGHRLPALGVAGFHRRAVGARELLAQACPGPRYSGKWSISSSLAVITLFVRPDLPLPAGCANRLAGRLGSGGIITAASSAWANSSWVVPGPEGVTGLRSGGLAGCHSAVGVLLVVDPAVRGGVHAASTLSGSARRETHSNAVPLTADARLRQGCRATSK